MREGYIMRIVRLMAAALLAGTSCPAIAQSEAPAEEAADDGDVIIVTARKREENLQDVPLTIAVTSADTIEKAKLVNVSDLAAQTPGFSYRQGFGRTGGGWRCGRAPFDSRHVLGGRRAQRGLLRRWHFRVGQYRQLPARQSGACRGHQGAAIGAVRTANFSGAVNYVTRKPSNDFTGKVKVTVAEHKSSEVSGYISGPIVKDHLAFRTQRAAL